jgi:hypothetical protein
MRPNNDFKIASDGSFETEAILGQCCYALGQGAGNMRIRRSAIAALRARYLDPVRDIASTWDDLAASVLPLLAQVGRLAAHLATQAGRTAITEHDFTQARRLVESSAHESSGLLIAGPVCPPVPGESDELRAGHITDQSEPVPVAEPPRRLFQTASNPGQTPH